MLCTRSPSRVLRKQERVGGTRPTLRTDECNRQEASGTTEFKGGHILNSRVTSPHRAISNDISRPAISEIYRSRLLIKAKFDVGEKHTIMTR